MPISILHVGLPLDHASIPAEEAPKIARRLADIQTEMRDAGYKYEIAHVAPDDNLEAFRLKVRTLQCDGVLIGGGVVGNPELRHFREQLTRAAREAAPGVRIMLFDHSVSVKKTVEEAFAAK